MSTKLPFRRGGRIANTYPQIIALYESGQVVYSIHYEQNGKRKVSSHLDSTKRLAKLRKLESEGVTTFKLETYEAWEIREFLENAGYLIPKRTHVTLINEIIKPAKPSFQLDEGIRGVKKVLQTISTNDTVFTVCQLKDGALRMFHYLSVPGRARKIDDLRLNGEDNFWSEDYSPADLQDYIERLGRK